MANGITLTAMLAGQAAARPGATALWYPGGRLTFADWFAQSNRLARHLIRRGVAPGSRVGLYLEKTPEAVVAFTGVAAASAVVLPMDYHQTPAYTQAVLDLAGVSALLVSANFLDLLQGLRLPPVVIVVGGAGGSHTAWDEALQGESAAPPELPVGMEDVVYLNLTSGATGEPKAALTTHANLYWNTRASIEALALVPADVHLCLFPVFGHPHELFIRSLYLGGASVLVEGIAPKAISAAIREHGVTCLMATASLYASLLHHGRAHAIKLPSLRLAESGGMFVNSWLAEDFRAWFGLPITPVWGSTETTGIALVNQDGAGSRPGAMGHACPYYEVRVVREDGEPADPEEVGELALRGPGVCCGYFQDPAATARQMRDGWFYPGDLVRQDRDGFCFFVSRKTGMMKVAGIKVFPTEIEDVLSRHPDIQEVAVVKAADALHGEVPRAVIVPRPGCRLDAAEVRRYCEGRLPRYKIPRQIEMAAGLPKTAGGKILYRQLESQPGGAAP